MKGKHRISIGDVYTKFDFEREVNRMGSIDEIISEARTACINDTTKKDRVINKLDTCGIDEVWTNVPDFFLTR
ncbi:MAG: hypothetical protein IJ733_11210 [Lachnospiraceae bacterium]|nr:hypothetical protein [Lachnospiraceae bacterium]